MQARCDIVRGGDRWLGDIGLEQPERAVGAGRSGLDQRHRADEGARQRSAADREILHGALRLRAPQGLCRYLQFAHAVAFGPEFPLIHDCLLRRPGPSVMMRESYHSRAFARPSSMDSSLTALSPVDGRYRAAIEPLAVLLSESGLIRERSPRRGPVGAAAG